MKMRRTHNIFYPFICLVSICLLMACSKDLDRGIKEDVTPREIISFTASLQADASPAPQVASMSSASHLSIDEQDWDLELTESSRHTRGLPIDTLDGLHVGVYAYEFNEDIKVADLMKNKDYSFINHEDLHPVGDPVLWSQVSDSNDLRIYAYAPRVTSSTSLVLSESNDTPSITYTVPDDVTQQIDLLCAKRKVVKGNYNQDVFLEFQHMLAAVRFKAGFDCTITSIRIDNVYSKGQYIMNGVWDHQDSLVTFTLPIPAEGLECKAGDMITDGDKILMMIPQVLPHDATLTMEYTEGGVPNTIVISLEDFEWKHGRLITYTISKSTSDDYVYFDLNAGNVNITATKYEGYVFVNGVATKFTKEFTADEKGKYKCYVYQSTSTNKGSVGYASQMGVGPHRRPIYPPVMIDGHFWCHFITDNTDVVSVIEAWDSPEGAGQATLYGEDESDDIYPNKNEPGKGGVVRLVGREATKNRIHVSGNVGDVHLYIDNLYSSYQQRLTSGTDAVRQRTKAGISFLPSQTSGNSTLTIHIIGDNRFGCINYQNYADPKKNGLVFEGIGSLTVADTDYFWKEKGIGNGSNRSCSVIGGKDQPEAQDDVYNITINSGVIYAGAVTSSCTAIGGGGNGHTNITINGGSITAVAKTTGTAIGGGTGLKYAGGKGDVTINNGNVYAYNYRNSSNVPSSAIGGAGSELEDGEKGTVNINGGYVYAYSQYGTAIGGGSSVDKNGGEAEIIIKGGDIIALSDDGNGIGGGSACMGGGKGNYNGGNAIIKISGNPIIRTGSIGGGDTKAEGGKLGNADITVSGGDITGQFIMVAGSAERSSFEMTGGLISNSDVNDKFFKHIRKRGAAVHMENGTFIMKGGTIKNCVADEGGAIYIKGIESPEFIMEGGEIFNNTATINGGAIYMEGGTVTIKGGQLRGNLARNGNGGAVYISEGDFYMPEGGVGYIEGNGALKTSRKDAGDGGAIYVTSLDSDVDVEVLSGRVENNVCDGNGGGICVDMAGTTRIANVKIGKLDGMERDVNPGISTNKAVRYGGGLYARGKNAMITINGGRITGNEVFNYVPNPDVSNEDGTVVLNGGQVKHQVVTFDANAEGATIDGETTAIQRIVTATNSALVFPTTPVRNFYNFIGWNSRPDGQGKTYVNGQNMNITEDITLYAQWRAQ